MIVGDAADVVDLAGSTILWDSPWDRDETASFPDQVSGDADGLTA